MNFKKTYTTRIVPVLILAMCILAGSARANTGLWNSKAIASPLKYTIQEARTPLRDFTGNVVTVVYLESLSTENISTVSNYKNVQWLLKKGYRVIELNYESKPEASGLNLNTDIIAINEALAAGSFCGMTNCSTYQSYVLFEGYRIERNLPYFRDDPTVYNDPVEYIDGDMLHMDVVYPVKPKRKIPVLLTFSYSNSFATFDSKSGKLTDANKNQRLKLNYTLAAFKDSFMEGAPAQGMAWAIADHPKYCQWGKGKPLNGKSDTYKSFETNPDAAQKVKSAVRTLRKFARKAGLSDSIGVFGFSRGSTAGSMAVGDRHVKELEEAGLNRKISGKVQAVALGPGVFDYTIIYNTLNDGDGNLESRCPWAWGPLNENRELWEKMGSAYLAVGQASAPVFFFYNTDDDKYYADQVKHFKAKLDLLNVPTDIMVNYGKGHAIPQSPESLRRLYSFFAKYLN